ncbi:glycine zipper domain-containing protein [Fontivita pretiosa]|uniref:glycine zipper domain-containing protein n=1 Tax=Fontivita pretiosa TaxID=2989684 RepID=UPI003D17DC03
MTQRIAAAVALVVFVVCLLAGAAAGNAFSTIVTRAMLAMAVTAVIGLIIGVMARRMLEENLTTVEEKLKKESGNSPESGR